MAAEDQSGKAGKLGKDLAEDQSGKAGGNAFLVKPAFLDGSLVECARVGRTGKERLPPEDESKHLQPVTAIIFREGEKAFVMAREIEKSREIHLKKLLRDGTGALIVEPPPCAVGENAPAEFAGGQVVHTPKIAEHLGRGRGLLTPAPGAAIKWPAPALGLDDREAELIALPFLGKAVGAVLSPRIMSATCSARRLYVETQEMDQQCFDRFRSQEMLQRLGTAGHRARPPGRKRRGFAAEGLPSTRVAQGQARLDRLRSGFHWVNRHSENR